MMRKFVIRKPEQYIPPELDGMTLVEKSITIETVGEFENIILNGNETSAHEFLEKYPYFLYPAIQSKGVGHHGMWYHSKPQIRPPLTNGKKGKIPDILLCGDGSGGKEWFIVELKSPQDKLFNGSSFSRIANNGLNQLAEYLIYSTEKQTVIRDALEIREFKTPYGIFIIGKDDETKENDIKQSLKSFWKSNMNQITILSYSNILNRVKEILHLSRNF